MKFEYRAFDKTGHEVCSVLDAGTLAEGAEKLRQQDLLVATIAPIGQALANASRSLRFPRGRIRKLRDLSMFTRQLYSLIHSGTPLAQGLYALERQARDPDWKLVVADLRVRLEQGSPLSEAMGAHRDYFDGVYRSIIAAGESSGKLGVLLERLATMTRKRVHVLSTIQSAMIYPILLAFIGAGVMSVLLLYVVPKFAELFKTLGAPIPPTTAFLIAASQGMQQYWYAVLGGLIVAVVGLAYYLRSPPGKRMVDTVVLKVPKVGGIVKSFATARIARLLGQLLDSHLPIQEILRLTRDSTANYHYAALLAKAEEAVGHGQPMSSAFRNSDLISPAVYEALCSGEQSGQVGALLLELADFLDEENDITLKSLTSIIEPVMLVLMAVVVGFVAISIFLPLFDVTGVLNGGAK